jgi:peroxiredoxin Q/BCP
VEADAEVLGVSSDPEASHRAFAEKYGLPFRLLADTRGEVRRTYGVPRTLGLLDGRMTFVIDRDGIVRHVFNSQFFPRRHVDEALAGIRRLGERGETAG